VFFLYRFGGGTHISHHLGQFAKFYRFGPPTYIPLRKLEHSGLKFQKFNDGDLITESELDRIHRAIDNGGTKKGILDSRISLRILGDRRSQISLEGPLLSFLLHCRGPVAFSWASVILSICVSLSSFLLVRKI